MSAFAPVAPGRVNAQACTPLESPAQALAPCLAAQRQVEVADLNGDQIPDLAITTANSLQIKLGSLDAAGVPTYQPWGSYPTPSGANGIAIADFNSDGFPDIAVAIESGGLLVFRGRGTAGVPNGLFEQYLSIFSGPLWEVRSTDMTGDGILDLVASAESGSILIYRGTGASGHGDGGFAFLRNIAVGPARGFDIADLDSDGILDIAVANFGSSIAVLKGLGSSGYNNGQFLPPLFVPTGIVSDRSFDIASADFNHDGHLDLVVSQWGWPAMSILAGSGALAFTAHVRDFNLFGLQYTANMVAVGDLNSDGLADIVVAHTQGTGGDPWTFSTLNNTFDSLVPVDGLPVFSENPISGFNYGNGITVADVNLDGGVDVLVAGSTSDSLKVFLNHCGAPPIRLWTPTVGGGVVQRSSSLPVYPTGSTIVLTAVPTPGNKFDGWTNGLVSTENPLTIRPTVATTIVAHFRPDPTVLAVGEGPLGLMFAPIEPNPSRAGARLQFSLPHRAQVRLAVFGASGGLIRTLADGELSSGRHEFAWDGRRDTGESAAAGIYWVALSTGGRNLSQRFTLLR